MTVRRILPFLLAALLGGGSALLAACGSGSDAGIPAADATTLKSQITDVREAVEDGRCSDVPGQLRQVDDGIDDLPPSVDDQLVNSLRDGANKLLGLAREECGATTTETTTTETTTTETTTETNPVETTTQPTETTTTQTTPTPPPTATQPAPPPEPVPEPVPPPPPAGTPGGGVEPVIPP
jgi:outer membrane biosynthesis protein TonB